MQHLIKPLLATYTAYDKAWAVISEISNESLGVKLRQAADRNMFIRHGCMYLWKLVTVLF
jgi:hypothetical protein